MLARVEAPPPAQPNKKLREELIKISQKQHEMLMEVLQKDQAKPSDREKLKQLYEKHTVKLCQLINTVGWPTTALVGSDGVFAAFQVLKSGPFELQRDLLPVIVAVIKKDPKQKSYLAGLYDRLRISAGMKQLFGTQAISRGGFLILYPLENPARVNALRAEFDLPEMDLYIRQLERTYGQPLIKARQPPSSELSEQLTESVTKAIDSTGFDPSEVEPGDVIKVETNLVSLNVSVFNSNLKKFVGALAKEDFQVRENGEEQTVTYFASTDVPFDLVLLIDLSGSTKDKRDLIKKSTLRFIAAARPEDRIAIVTFADKPSIVSPLTLDRTRLIESVQSMEGQGGSAVWDAVKFVLDEVIGPKSLERRRAVVLMSDGVDGTLMRVGPRRGSQTTFASLLEQVRQVDALLVPIYLDTEDSAGSPFLKDEYENARRVLNLLAGESGGSYYHARKLADLEGVYQQVINDLGKVYSLGYKPTNPARDGSWRSVEVTIANRPELTARNRPGYYAQ